MLRQFGGRLAPSLLQAQAAGVTELACSLHSSAAACGVGIPERKPHTEGGPTTMGLYEGESILQRRGGLMARCWTAPTTAQSPASTLQPCLLSSAHTHQKSKTCPAPPAAAPVLCPQACNAAAPT